MKQKRLSKNYMYLPIQTMTPRTTSTPENSPEIPSEYGNNRAYAKKYALPLARRLRGVVLTLLYAVGISCVSDGKEVLWYNEPADVRAASLPWAPDGESDSDKAAPGGDVWESKTLPLGNGRIGATVYSGMKLDAAVLNEVSLWSGGENLPNNGSGYGYGPLAGSDQFGSYQPFAHFFVHYDLPGELSDYRRNLNLEKAEVTCSFSQKNNDKNIKHKRICFVSKPDDVFVYRVEAEGDGTIDANIGLLPFHNVSYTKDGKNGIRMAGALANGEAFEGRLIVNVEDGTTKVAGGNTSLTVEYPNPGADSCMPKYNASGVPYVQVRAAKAFTVIISLATDYKMDYAAHWKGDSPGTRNKRILSAVAKSKFSTLRKKHEKDFASLYKRLSLQLEGDEPDIPTNERLEKYKNGEEDVHLEQLLFQYGRYLMISGSRPGNLPMNLQGIWNNKVHAPWACDYHTNINFQMCYWSAEASNLSECHLPLLDYLYAMRKPLAEFTQRVYGKGMPGWTMRISHNPWGGVGWVKLYPAANAWFALHLWEHYLYTQDSEFLRKRAYPIFKELCDFWQKRLKPLGAAGKGLESDGKPLSDQEHPELKLLPTGTLVVPAGWSHEWGPTEDGCMHDQQVVRELFKMTAEAADALNTDSGYAARLRSVAEKMAPDRVAPGGYLQEWIVDRPNMVSGHRHTSHLFALYPGSTISLSDTPDLAKAAARSLELRGLSADNRRSWTWPWRAALYARLHDAPNAYEMLRNLLRYNTLYNMLATHPPMQMDGSLGIPAAICEMLVQSHTDSIELLPALPPAWKSGKVKGLRARGNITIDMEWKDGQVTSAVFRSPSAAPGRTISVIINGKKQQAELQPLKQKSKKKSSPSSK